MYAGDERREERRLNCDWMIWFASDPNQNPDHGVIHDLSSKAVSFSCHITKENFPQEGQELNVYFHIPNTEWLDMLRRVTRTGRVGRVETIDELTCRVELKFYGSLYFQPSELEAVNIALSCKER